jgi:hypothetical protein
LLSRGADPDACDNRGHRPDEGENFFAYVDDFDQREIKEALNEVRAQGQERLSALRSELSLEGQQKPKFSSNNSSSSSTTDASAASSSNSSIKSSSSKGVDCASLFAEADSHRRKKVEQRTQQQQQQQHNSEHDDLPAFGADDDDAVTAVDTVVDEIVASVD